MNGGFLRSGSVLRHIGSNNFDCRGFFWKKISEKYSFFYRLHSSSSLFTYTSKLLAASFSQNFVKKSIIDHQKFCVINSMCFRNGIISVESQRAAFCSSAKLMRKRLMRKNIQEVEQSKPEAEDDSEEEELTDDDNDDDTDSEVDLYEEEDRKFNKNYKDIKAVVKSLRMDSIAGAGLNVARNKVEELFLDSKLRLNGDRVLKKSIKLESGDYVDVISENSEAAVKVKRVRLLSVSEEKTQKDKYKVKLRVWRQNTQISSDEVE